MPINLPDKHILDSIIRLLLASAPYLSLWAIGIVIALSRWEKHPEVSLLVVISLSVNIIHSILSAIWHVWLPAKLTEKGFDQLGIARISMRRAIISMVIQLAIWVTLLFAIFGWRSPNT